MKTLIEYINENIILNEALILFKPTAKTAQNAANVEDKLKSFFNNSKKRYSFENQTDIKQMYNDFVKYARLDNKVLKEFNIVDGKTIVYLIVNNKEALEAAGWNFNCIKSFDESEMEKEYKSWKNSDNYVEGKKFNREEYKDADEEELKRILVVYDRNDPGNEDTVIEYEFTGKRTKENSHQANMCKMDWAYSTGLDYWKNANTILLSNYLKKTDAELAKREVVFDDSDLTEI